MPALRAWGRRWLVADDDFAVVAVVPCFVHFAFIPPLIAWFALVLDPDTSCDEQMEYTVAFSGILASYSISFVLELATVVVGFRGTPLDQKGTNRRKWISRLVHFDTLSHIIQVAFVGYLSYVGAKSFKRFCFTSQPWNDDAFVWSVVGVFWTYCLFYLVFLVFCWDSSGKHRHANECWDRTYMRCLWSSVLWFGWNPFNRASRRYHRERAARFGKNMKSLFGHCDMSVTDFVLAFMNARHRARHAGVLEVAGYGLEGGSGSVSGLTTSLLDRSATISSLGSEDRVYGIETRGESGDLHDGGDGVSAVEDGENDVMTLESLLASNVYRNTRIPGDPVKKKVLEDVAYYYKFALAAYGWMLYFLGRGFFKGLWAVLFGGKGVYFPMFRGRVNEEIACREIGTARSNILFLREQGDKENVLCYVIAVDHEQRVVVVSVRGALTVDDNVRDLLLDPGMLNGYLEAASKGSWEVRPPKVELVTDLSRPGEIVAQGDYLEACRATLCDILDCGVLESALRDYEGYGLTFSGHSLGAVGSFFLGLYFEKWIPNVHCWCFSPPAGLVDESVAESCASWCTSVANGKEIVPRFSAANLDRARDELVCSLASVDVSKWRRLYRLIWKYWKVYRADDDLTRPLNLGSLSDDTREFLEDYVQSRNMDEHRRYLVSAANRMSLPGKVIYFEPIQKAEDAAKTDSGREDMVKDKREEGPLPASQGSENKENSPWSGSFRIDQLWPSLSSFDINLGLEMMLPNDRDYVPKYVKNADVKAQGVILSGRLLADHMPDYAEEVLRKMRERK